MERVVNLSISILTRSLRLVDRIIPVGSSITLIPIIADLIIFVSAAPYKRTDKIIPNKRLSEKKQMNIARENTLAVMVTLSESLSPRSLLELVAIKREEDGLP